MYYRPYNILIYYGYPNSFNSSSNGWNNSKVAMDMAKYQIVILGDGVQNPSHPDYNNSKIIIPKIKEINPNMRIYGYVTVNQSYSNFSTKVGQWNTLGVHGIFLDEAGYDYGTVTTNGREAFNNKINLVHSKDKSNICFVNAWKIQHILGTENDVSYPNSTYNSDLIESNLNRSDWFLLESFSMKYDSVGGSVDFEDKDEWYARGEKAFNYRNLYNINLASGTIIDPNASDAQDLFDFIYCASAMFALDAVGSSSLNYGATTAQIPFYDRPTLFSQGTTLHNCFYHPTITNAFIKYAEFCRIELDFTSSSESATITDW